MIDLKPLGDRAFLAKFVRESDAQRWVHAVRALAIPGVVEVTLAYASAAVFLDPDRADPDEMAGVLRRVKPGQGNSKSGPLIRLPVLYDGDDLAQAAGMLNLTEAEVIKRHSIVDYVVYAIGFLPGFPYAGYLPNALAGLPRLETPRVKVPAGSVAIAGRQTGVYPGESPGGWRLIGRTPLRIVDLERSFFPIKSGDRLRFEPIGEGEFRARLGEPLGRA
jgi:KipI family sensor histidine kinase inhibitor